MTVSELITAENVTLTNCDREEIHSPGSIQPHGLLFVLTEPQLEIVQVSQNTAKRLGVSAQVLLGKRLSDLLGAAQVELVKHCLNEDFEGVNPIKLSINQAGYRFLFNGILHRSQANIILELEPIESTTEPNFLSFYQMIKAPIAKLQKAASLSELCDTIVQDVRKLTGFDRVMIYQFDANQAGTVIAEDKLDTWLENQWVDNLFYTDCLCQHSPKMEPLKAIASGLIAVSITQVRKNYILWFRPEVVQVVNWAGNPNKPTKIEADGSLTISPRQSFAKWQESVQGKSLPWQNCEVEGALELRSAIVGIVLRKADVLAEVNVELERSNSELDSFAYIASHDLKEPLRGIHNYSNFLLQDYADILNGEGVEKLKTLVRLTQRMEDLINGLLHFSRLGRQELKVQPVDLNKLVQNVKEILYVSQKDVQFELRIPQPLPHIHCDPLLIEEVFVNLISNALKYNNNSLKWVEIGFWESNQDLNTEEAEKTNWGFYVRDNGIGIRQKHLDSIFRIFKRLHSPNKYGGGTGAGLTIVKKIIERHNGRIWLESTYGEGTTFYFTLQPTVVEQEIVA
jgi:light-regulated signal transduction histidine kinase (bacteriophytochrome)